MSAASAALSTPEGPLSVAGAPNLPAGFTDAFTSRYVDTGELRLHAVIGGDGPPVLLVHGWPQTWYAWRMVMPALARDVQVIAVDQRGIGLSDKPQDGYDTATLAGDLVALMEALGHRRFAVYGTDTGMPTAYAWPPITPSGWSAWSYRAVGTTIAQNEQRKTRRLTMPVLAIGGDGFAIHIVVEMGMRMLDHAVLANLRNALGACHQADDKGVAGHFELRRERHAWHQRHIGSLEAAIGEIDRGRRL